MKNMKLQIVVWSAVMLAGAILAARASQPPATTQDATAVALDKLVPEDANKRNAAFQKLKDDRNDLTCGLLLFIRMDRPKPGEVQGATRLYWAIRMLGEIRAAEAAPELLSIVDVRFALGWTEIRGGRDREVILALAQIGKPASVKALTYIAKDTSRERAKMYVRVIALVEGVELGKVMVSQAAEKEKDPQYKERLQKAVELFKDADKVVQ